jgi:hypothetical protein
MGSYSCACGARDTYFNSLNIFWKSISIRHKTAFQYNEKIVNIYNKQLVNNSTIMEKLNVLKDNLINEFFYSKQHPEIAKNLFSQLIDHHKTELEDLLLALVFLTICDKNSVKISFKKMLKYYKPDYLTSQSTNETLKTADTLSQENDSKKSSSKSLIDKNLYIKKPCLSEILKIYVNLISLFTVDYLAEITPEKEDFIISMKEEFSFENQEKYVNKKLEFYDSEAISIDEFFDREFSSLSDDSLVRNGISYCNFSKTNVNFFSTFSTDKSNNVPL